MLWHFVIDKLQSFTNDIPVLIEPLFSFLFVSNCGLWKYFSVDLIMKILLNCLKQKTPVTLNEENFRCTTDHIILPSLVSIFKFCCYMQMLQYIKLWSCYWLTLLHNDIPSACIEWFILNFPLIQFCIVWWWTLDFFTLHCYYCWLNSTNKEYVQGSHVVHNTCLYY